MCTAFMRIKVHNERLEWTSTYLTEQGKSTAETWETKHFSGKETAPTEHTKTA